MEALKKETRGAKAKGPARKKAAVAVKAKAKRKVARKAKPVKVVYEEIGMEDPADEMMAAIHESATGMHAIGLIDKETMREFDESCLPKVTVYVAKEIAALRLDAGVSQAVFAQYLNTTKSTISQWEQAKKKPSSIAQKLLNIVADRGLKALA